jgi:hypothetical protein
MQMCIRIPDTGEFIHANFRVFSICFLIEMIVVPIVILD